MGNVKAKPLYQSTYDKTGISIRCEYNIVTNHIGIYTIISKGGRTPRPLNISSPVYLGVTIAEKLLSNVFKNVQVMPYGHKGYDIICNQGYLIDIKSSTINKDGSWYFGINKNKIADYFLCIAFDDRFNLNPLHLWLIPGHVVNHFKGKSIKPVSLKKWSQYELTEKNKDVISCCNMLKGDHNVSNGRG